MGLDGDHVDLGGVAGETGEEPHVRPDVPEDVLVLDFAEEGRMTSASSSTLKSQKYSCVDGVPTVAVTSPRETSRDAVVLAPSRLRAQRTW